MSKKFYSLLQKEIDNFKQAGLFKSEFVFSGKHGVNLTIGDKQLLDFTSDDYFGLSNTPALKKAATSHINEHGMGPCSIRVVNGTYHQHIQAEKALMDFFEKEDAILYGSSYLGNAGFFDCFFNYQDYIFCDTFCDPSIIDGVYQTSSKKCFYRRNDITDLEDQLKRSPRARFRIIVTEGVYHVDGKYSELYKIVDLAEKYDALVYLHDSYGVGLLGDQGRGCAEHYECLDKVDIISGSLGQAMGLGQGGYMVGPSSIIQWLKQASKTYVFATAIPQSTAAAVVESVDYLREQAAIRSQLFEKTKKFRNLLIKQGFKLIDSNHPIVAILTGEAVATQKMVDALYNNNILVQGLCYPMVPRGRARIKLNLTTGHTWEQVQEAAEHLTKAGEQAGILEN